MKELCERLDLEARQIRYLISQGIMPSAAKLGTAADAYDEEHVRCGEMFKRMHAEGLSVPAIVAELSVVARGCGLEIRILDAEAFENATEEDLSAFIRDAKKKLDSLRKTHMERT